MKPHACTAERFALSVRGHQMTVVHADGLHRHLRFKTPGDSTYWFDVVTWPGALCISGDCGSYVFSRTPDMFNFFRAGNGGINPAYWAEKLLAADRSDGIEEWSPSGFRREVVSAIRDYYRGTGNFAGQLACFRAARENVLRHDDSECFAMQAVFEFEHGRFTFADFGGARVKEYTFRYIWCLRAIVWAIGQFDQHAGAASVAGTATA